MNYWSVLLINNSINGDVCVQNITACITYLLFGFNVPFGNYKTPTIYNKDEILELHNLFNKYDVQFLNLDFEKFSENIKKDDFAYFDPPYYPLKKTSFTSYKDDSFHDKENDGLCMKK